MKCNYRNIIATAPAARIGIVCMLMAAALLACMICAPQALARQTIEMPDGWSVSDDVTRVHVTKVDKGTHEALKGAKMAIIDKETGKVIDEWTTDGTTHEIEKILDVGRTYILRELEAPEGYEKVKDTTFVVNEVEGAGITILDCDSSSTELSESYKVTLYDQHVDIVKEKTTTKKRTVTTSPKTGDETPLVPVGALAGVAIVAIGVLQLVKKRIAD